jgi:tape measure domain-containing protein
MSNAARNATNDFDRMSVSAKRIGGYIATYFSVQGLINFGKAVLDTTIKMESLQKAIEFTSKSAIGGQANLEFLRQTAEKFGIPLEAAVEGFKSLSAAAGRNNLPMATQRQMFTDLSAAMSALSLTAQDAQLVFFGFGQMLSKPKVSAQELYHQIGERLPIAIEAAQIAAAKLTGQTKVTAGELTKLVETGKLLSSEFAPAFTEALGKLAGPGALVDTLGKDVTRLSTAWTEFKNAIGNLTGDYLTDVLRKIQKFVEGTKLEIDFLNYYLSDNNIFKSLAPGYDVESFKEFKKNSEDVIAIYDGIVKSAEDRFSELNTINSELQKVLTDSTKEGLDKRNELEKRYAQERLSVTTEINSEIKKREIDIQKFKQDIIETQKKIDNEYLRTGYTQDLEKRINKNKQYIKQAEAAIKALQSLYGSVPEQASLLPDPDAEKKRVKSLEDEYRKIIAAIEARKTAEDDRIKASTREGYTRDIKLLENNVKFNEEMLAVDESARFKNLELAKNNAVKRKGENERDNQEQLNIRKKALDEALKIEEEYFKRTQDKLDENALKRRQAKQTELQNDIEDIQKNTDDQVKVLIEGLNKEVKVQEIGEKERLAIVNRYNAQITKVKQDSLNQQLHALQMYYDEQEKLDEQAAFDRNEIYIGAATRRLAADAKNEYDRQDILDQGALADITNNRNRLLADEKRLKTAYGLSEQYREREAAMIKANLADLASQEYEIQVNAEKRKQEKMLEIVQASADAMSQIFNDLANLYISNLDREKEALSQKYDADVRLADGNKQKLAQLAQEKARAEYEIELKQFKARQIMAVAEVIFKTAPEIAKWISTGVLAPVAAIGLAAQAFAIGAILAQPPPVPPYKDGTKGIPHPGGPALVGEAGTEKVITTDGQVYYTPPMATLVDLPKGAQVIPNHALSRRELFLAGSLNEKKPGSPNSDIGHKLDRIGGILEGLPVHQVNMNEKGFEKFIRTPRRTTKILNNQFPVKH